MTVLKDTLLAVDQANGQRRSGSRPTRGRMAAARPVPPRPFVWNDEIIVHRGPEVVAFDRKDGTKKWWVRTQSTSAGTPVVGRDAVYIGTWFPVGEPDLRVPLPDFSTLLQSDKNAVARSPPTSFPRRFNWPSGSRSPSRGRTSRFRERR